MRVAEELVREHAVALEGDQPEGAMPAATRRLPAPALLELEELLGDYLNTRVKVLMTGRRGKVTIEFSDLEDLERVYRLMVSTQQPAED